MTARRPDIADLATKLVTTHGSDAVLVARRWAGCSRCAGDAGRTRMWEAVETRIKRLLGRAAQPCAAARVTTADAQAPLSRPRAVQGDRH